MSAAAAPMPPLYGSQRVLATLVLALANFMVVLDMTIANVSVPHIAGSLAASPNQGTWVITSYAVAEAIIVPLTGWLTTRFGAVRLFVLCIIGFALSSLLCALSPTLGALIAARVVQGLCGGPIMPLSQTLLLSSYPPEKSGQALSFWAMTTLVAPIAGPLIGGVIADNLAWEWIFYVNIPIGMLCAMTVWGVYRARETPRLKLPIDYIGLILLILWVGALQLLLDKGRELDWFGSPLIVSLGIVAVVAFALFVVWELTDEHPVVDLRIFSHRSFTAAILAMSLIFGVFFGYIVLLPLWLQTWLGYTSLQAGLAVAPMGILAIVMAFIVGATLKRVDPRIYATLALSVFVVVFFWRSNINADVDFHNVWLPQLAVGLGMTTLFLPLTVVGLSDLKPSQIATASGLQNFVRTLFGAFGAAAATSYWDDGVVRHHAELASHVSLHSAATRQALDHLSALGLPPQAQMQIVEHMIDQQAAVMALSDYLLLAGLLALLMAPLIWLTRRPTGSVDMQQVH